MRKNQNKGFTLIELLIVIAIVGIIAATAVPGLLRARIAGNEASAIASLRTINSSQHAFSAGCAHGLFAVSLASLLNGPTPASAGFISADLGTATPVKSGYTMSMGAGSDGVSGTVTDTACNGVTAAALHSSYYATALPIAAGGSGARFFWTNRLGAIYEHTALIADTLGNAPPSAGPIPIGK